MLKNNLITTTLNMYKTMSGTYPKGTDTCLADDLFFEQSGYTVCRRVLEGDPYSGL